MKIKTKNPVDYFNDDSEARFVSACLANREKLELLIKSMALEAKNGRVVLHFDALNVLREIRAEVFLYKK